MATAVIVSPVVAAIIVAVIIVVVIAIVVAGVIVATAPAIIVGVLLALDPCRDQPPIRQAARANFDTVAYGDWAADLGAAICLDGRAAHDPGRAGGFGGAAE